VTKTQAKEEEKAKKSKKREKRRINDCEAFGKGLEELKNLQKKKGKG